MTHLLCWQPSLLRVHAYLGVAFTHGKLDEHELCIESANAALSELGALKAVSDEPDAITLREPEVRACSLLGDACMYSGKQQESLVWWQRAVAAMSPIESQVCCKEMGARHAGPAC